MAEASRGIGEFELIARLSPFLAEAGDGVLVGHGDDAAVIDVGGRGVCVAVDVLVEDVHFRRDLSSLEDVGWKAVAVNVSDIAAMGAAPTVAVVGLTRPATLAASDVEALYRGMDAACARYGLRLVGGDTVAGGALAVSVTVLGEVDPQGVVRRSGARPGDQVLVAGTLGTAAAALAQVAADVPADPLLLAAHRRPEALVKASRALASHGATAMIDVSDGLGADLGHLCSASGVGAVVRAADLPFGRGVAVAAAALGRDPLEFVCAGGDDYALVATVPADEAEAAAAAAGAVVVGEVVSEPPEPVLLLADGTARTLAGGWDHYRTDTSGGGQHGARE